MTTKTERMARLNLMRSLIYLQQQSWIPETIADEIPDLWHTLELDAEVDEEKEKVTLYLDRSVARFYRAMGKGYQARINRLLATYMQMHLARELRTEEVLRERVGDEGA